MVFSASILRGTGGASVIRNWGGIGTHGQSMMETFDGQEEATHVFERLA